MHNKNLFNWIIIGFAVITFFPLLVAQVMVLFDPDNKKTKNVIIGKGGEWRDSTHRKTALAFAFADCLLLMPFLVAGSIAVINNQLWGYIIWCALGAVSVYFSILFWVLEREYTYPVCGPVAYNTYYWGFYLYWGIGATVYSIVKIYAIADGVALS